MLFLKFPRPLQSYLNHLQIVIRKYTMNNSDFIKSTKGCIPPLDGTKHKGQAGRIGIVGGSLEYTGAPYFAGISALKVGADLVHVFCASTAATVIKSYSPELIVHPLLDAPQAIKEISPWIERLHVLVIGPGLGREAKIFTIVSELINITRQKRIPLVIDADGLFLITENPELLKDYPSPGVILTPNIVEYQRLESKIKDKSGSLDLCQFGGNVTIFKKAPTDEFCSVHPEVNWKSNLGGSGRRCGGQGDLLSGAIATFFNWTLTNKDKINIRTNVDKPIAASSMSCYSASRMIRLCNEKAYKAKGRSMLASDMIEYIHESFEELFGK